MRNLLEYPITPDEVLNYLEIYVTIEDAIVEMSSEMGCIGSFDHKFSEQMHSIESIDPMCAKIALEVVKAATTIVQNDIGSSAADLLAKAFQSQDIKAKEAA